MIALEKQEWVSVKVLAERYGLPASWWYAKAAAGQIPHRKLGKYVRFETTEIAAWIEQQRRESDA